jgi:hypothetical protein
MYLIHDAQHMGFKRFPGIVKAWLQTYTSHLNKGAILHYDENSLNSKHPKWRRYADR